nr:uncharacterized protein LOC123281135 isoform X2 [Equus asinus]
MQRMTGSCRGPDPAVPRPSLGSGGRGATEHTGVDTAWHSACGLLREPSGPWRPATQARRRSPSSSPAWPTWAVSAGTAKGSAPSCKPMWPPARLLVSTCGPGGSPTFGVQMLLAGICLTYYLLID